MPDRLAVVDLSTPDAMGEELKGAVGLASSFVDVCLVSAESGIAKTGAVAGTVVTASRTAVNFEDARIDQVRLVVYGNSTTTGHSARIKDVTGGGTTILCTVTLASSAGYAEGEWTLIDSIGTGSRQLVLEVVGNASATQTLYHASLQGRTLRLIRK